MRPLLVLVVAALLVAGCSSSSSPRLPMVPVTHPGTSAVPRPRQPAPADWPSYHGDAARTGVSTSMPPASGTLRVIASLKLDGAVYASPVAARGTIIVATEHNSVYAFDTTHRQRWHVRLGDPSPGRQRPCGNIDPLGITGTPVIHGGTVYVAPELSGSPPRHELVALSLTTGAVQWQRSLDLPGVDAAAMQERGALTVTGGRVWVPFGGLLGDCGNYKGRVLGYRVDGSGSPVSFTVPTAREAGIWTPPGPTVGPDGNLFVSVGNGASGVGDRYDHSDSVLKLSTGAKLLDSFSPASWPTDNDSDLDLGSQGPALVGRWVFIAGKSGTAYVLRRDQLGGVGGQVSSAKVCTSFGGTAVSGDVVYVPCTDGVRAVRIDASGQLHVLWHAAGSITGSPVLGGGRVWSLDPGAGVLHALDPRTGRSLADVQVGGANRFATPALHGRDVLVPTLKGLSVVAAS